MSVEKKTMRNIKTNSHGNGNILDRQHAAIGCEGQNPIAANGVLSEQQQTFEERQRERATHCEMGVLQCFVVHEM